MPALAQQTGQTVGFMHRAVPLVVHDPYFSIWSPETWQKWANRTK